MRTLAAATVLALIPLGAPPLAAATVATCQGQPATHVGKPGRSLTGTNGADVMVSRGASHVNGLGGADFICVTGSTEDGYRVRVSGGDGDDSVVVTTTNTVRAFLGDGADTYRGGAEVDLVHGGDFDDDEFNSYQDDDADSFSTGGGDDQVTASAADTVTLGSGDDGLQWHAPAAQPYTGPVDGGPGRNYLELGAFDPEGGPASWLLDTSSRTLSRAGESLASWSRFTRFGVRLEGVAALSMTGSAADESFSMYPAGLETPPITIDARGGDDTIYVGGNLTPGEFDLDIDAGPGRDLLHVYGYEFFESSLAVDLEAGRYLYQDKENTRTVPITSVEDAEVQGVAEVTLRGDSSANRLTVHADQTDFPVLKRCQITMAGSGGDDRLVVRSTPIEKSWKNCPRPVLRGEAGNDVLVGSLLPERLLGGPGRDVARGGPGTDVCAAETQMGCERR